MRMTPRRHTIWLLVLSLLVTLLAPGLSHALREPGATAGWAEICSVGGSRWLPVEEVAGGEGQEAPLGQAPSHCLLCGGAAAPLGPAAAQGWLVPAPLLGRAIASPPRAAAPCRPAWPAAQPRGPPQQA
ncbi:DUF2946 family protein [Paucibacter sp. PLA-PC-4]|uniref:DUF2946 family protein n=1 Tax=Paucibacter sp. PLA-PC-4 TaxID=2993655 RepID=UPI0022487B66|nr:DUF2946 family protein [Paucibacter sp. PLA-PC-4]MCX2862196.1 DUF2946 family protein [Paucibacter sp. PLA-PC-4]